jgi:hypothetical protein
VLTAARTLSLSIPLSGQANSSSACFGGTFAWDGAYDYFSAGVASLGNLAYLVYDGSGSLVPQYTAAGGGGINGIDFDRSVARYTTHDGWGGRTGGSSYGQNTGDDTQRWSPVSAVHTLM